MKQIRVEPKLLDRDKLVFVKGKTTKTFNSTDCGCSKK